MIDLMTSLSNISLSEQLKTELLSVTERIKAEVVATTKPVPDPHQAHIAARKEVKGLNRVHQFT